MEAFSFILKIFLFTALLVWAMQFDVDNKPLEKHFIEFVRYSKVADPIHKIAQGSRKLANDGWAGMKSIVDGDAKSRSPSAESRKASTFKWSWGSGASDEAQETE